MKNQRNVLLALALLAAGMPLIWRGWPASAQIKSEVDVRLNQKVEAVMTFTVINTAVDGAGSLRQAILDANGNAGADTINFNIPASDPNCNAVTLVCTIKPTVDFPLPAITDRVTINGYSQGVAHANTLANGDDAVLLIEIDGSLHTASNIAFLLQGSSGGSVIRGLVIDNWGSGILTQTDSLTVDGCFIGIDPSGTLARLNNTGIYADFNTPTSGMHIGGTTPAARNVISGNNKGIFFQSGSNHVVQGNFFGTDRNGTAAVANIGAGVTVQFSDDDLIGGTTVAARNIIAGNGSGISVESGNRTRIQGNYIGTDVTGTLPLGGGPAFNNGISLDTGPSTQIGGLTSSPGTPPGNLISSYRNSGILIGGGANASIQGNLIGTNASGTSALGNIRGISVQGNSNVIGGTDAMARNIISGNSFTGIEIASIGAPPEGNRVQGNFIGTDITGTQVLGNAGDGVFVSGNNNTIGGISGGAGQDPGNTIAGNGGRGVNTTFSTTGLSILGNSIHSNGSLGIDLGGDGLINPNDNCDGDSGANNLQNYPVITKVVAVQGLVSISGTLNSAANTTFQLEFFSSTSGDPSGSGEGKTPLGSTNVTTDGTCNASFSSLIFDLPSGEGLMTATATRLDGSLNPIETSEFSAFMMAPTAAPVTISGRARTAEGRSVYGARISLMDQDGNLKTAISNPFGYFRFDGVVVGRTYIIAAKHKVYQFPPRGISVTDNIVDLELVADPLVPK